ncbi:DUF2730 family protein [Salipiger marinus]|uniref:DUF2730 family protein n=1 Tax=Salipiger marinus TaxID=555512 RepID=UPI004057EF1F
MIVDLDLLLKLASFGLSVGAMVFAFFANRQKGNDERFKAGADRMDRHELRIQTLEQSVRVLPTLHDMHELQLQLARLNGNMERMDAHLAGQQEIMKRVETVVARHEDHLLKGQKG